MTPHLTPSWTHGTSLGMRVVIFVLSTFIAAFCYAKDPISGTINRIEHGRVFIKNSGTCPQYLVVSTDAETIRNIRKLSVGDVVTGTGITNSSTCTISVSSIDYVGLRKLLGFWYSAEGILTFNDFSTLRYYPVSIKGGKYVSVRYTSPVNYRYSVTLSGGKEWVLFLSDEQSTTFATIQINNRHNATLNIFDSDSGVPTQTLELTKWGTLKP